MHVAHHARRPWIPALLATIVLIVPARAEEALFEKGAKPEKVSTGYRFTEGPAANADGDVFFTDIPNQRILRLDVKTDKVRIFREDSGRANGLMFDAEGRLVACEGGRRRLVRYEKDGQVTVLAERFQGKRLNSPNDLAIDGKGGIYFTDPRYGRGDDRELDYEGVFYRAADGALTRVAREVVKPNGILLAKGGRTLYVADNRLKLLMAYEVKAPGKPANGRLFARLDAEARGGPDGLTADARGHVYAAGQGRIWIWDAKGRRVATIAMPEGPTNCTFGGPKRKTLYVTARTSLYRLPMKVAGTR